MFKLDVNKHSEDDYSLCIYKEGSGIEEYISLDDTTVRNLVVDCCDVLGKPTSDEKSLAVMNRATLVKQGVARHLILTVGDGYTKCFTLSETEVKLFQASLKRAIDG